MIETDTKQCIRCFRVGTRSFVPRRNTIDGSVYYTCKVKTSCSKRRVRRLKAVFPHWGT